MCYYPFFPGADLPDDDYTTYVPISRNSLPEQNGKSSQIPVIVGTTDDDTSSNKSRQSNKKSVESRNIIITGVSKNHSNADNNPAGRARSAPSSPALSQIGKTRSAHHKTSLSPIENESKSVCSEHGSLTNNGLSNVLSSGSLEVRLKLDAKSSKMWVFILKANIELMQRSTKPSFVQIHLTVLPNKKIRYRTRPKPIENALFTEEFFCKVATGTIETQGIRFRLYSSERFKREKLLGEANISFGMINLQEDTFKTIPFRCVFSSDDSDLASCSRANSVTLVANDCSNSIPEDKENNLQPELEIGLGYDRAQSMFVLEIGKAINIGLSSQGQAPDSYVQITLFNGSDEEIMSNRTATCHSQHNPLYAERYPFNIQEALLHQITFLIAVRNKNSTNKSERDFGWISFGHKCKSKAQSEHWESMLNSDGSTTTRWHVLSDS